MDLDIEDSLHSKLIDDGNELLLNNPNFSVQSIIDYSVELCEEIITKYDKSIIVSEFQKSDFSDGEFRDDIKNAIEIGTVKFILSNQLYRKYITNNDLIKIVASVNFGIAYYMVQIFNKKGLRFQPEPCIYSNNALSFFVNRSLNLFMDKENLKQMELILGIA